MKKTTKIIIRTIGIIFEILAVFMAYKGMQDDIVNGIEFGVVFFALVGLYLLFGKEESLKSWNLFEEIKNAEEDEEFEDYYD